MASYYVYNNRFETGFVSGYKAYLSRTPLSQLFQQWEYRTANGWSADINNSVNIATPLVSPSYSAFEQNGKYYLLTQQLFGTNCGDGREIYTLEGDQPWGPFQLRRWVYTVEDQFNGSYLATYNATAHPALIEDGQLLVSYNVNDGTPETCPNQCQNGSIRQADTYRPKFIRVPLEAMRQEALLAQADLFLLAGQSNAVGQGEQSESAVPAPGTAFFLNLLQNILYPLEDPVGYNDPFFSFQQANTGSLAPAFGIAYQESCGRIPILVHTAVAGSACHAAANPSSNWSATGTLFNRSITRTNAAISLTGLPLSGIIWSQGETDAGKIRDGVITPEAYESALNDLIGRYRNQYGGDLPFFMVQTGRNFVFPDDEGYQEVRQVQENLAQTDVHSWLVYDSTRYFQDLGWMKPDLIHYNQAGLNHIGASIGTKICQILTDNDADGFNALVDCDDFDGLIYPGAAELCDGIDNNCNGMGDEPADCIGPCADHILNLNDLPIAENVYRAASAIFSAGEIATGTTVHFRAGETITLQAGFRALPGCVFSAKIASCTPPPASLLATPLTAIPPATAPQIRTQKQESPSFFLQCYPNPFREGVNIHFGIEQAEKAVLEIIDVAGRRVADWSSDLILPSGEYQYQWQPPAGLQAGMFFVILHTATGKKVNKLVWLP